MQGREGRSWQGEQTVQRLEDREELGVAGTQCVRAGGQQVQVTGARPHGAESIAKLEQN